MTDDRRNAERRRSVRRTATTRPASETPESTGPESKAVVPIAAPSAEPVDAKPRRGGFATFAAQVLGQGGQKRGLRGGPETLDKARSTYLETEWSGPADRRPHPGRITKTEI
jgi:hypothetical protein